MAFSSVTENAERNEAVPAPTDGVGRESRGGVVRGARGEQQYPSDDEILGLGVRTRERLRPAGEDEGMSSSKELRVRDEGRESQTDKQRPALQEDGGPARYREIFEANPELRQAWEEAQSFRESFATPEEAQSATKSLADLRTIDSLFFSERPQDHAELARLVAQLDPRSFGSLVKAMSRLAAERDRPVVEAPANSITGSDAGANISQEIAQAGTLTAKQNGVPREQEQFLQSANSEAVKGVLAAIESQVDRLLPENPSNEARRRVVGEIYRDLDQALQSNDQFAKQVRNAMRSGGLDGRHRAAVVSLIVNRARQVLPSVAKRVMTEWSSTILASGQDRKMRQRSAESRVDISGARAASNDGARIRSSRDIDYGRMSDTDILNL